jgi:hypothetical protein
MKLMTHMNPTLSRAASEIKSDLEESKSPSVSDFRRIAFKVEKSLLGRFKFAAESRDSEWQRVNSYIADVLKDAHVLYSKLARLQGDFTGTELDNLEKISNRVLEIGGELSSFMKEFHEGEAVMSSEVIFGSPPDSGAPPGTPPPQIPSEFEGPEEGIEVEVKETRPEEDYETEIKLEDEGEFSEFEEPEEKKEE